MNFVLIFLISLFFLSRSFKIASLHRQRLYVIGYLFLMCCVIGIRGPGDTPDTAGYLEFYSEIEPGVWSRFSWYGFEPGFQFLTHIVKIFVGYNTFVYLFLVAAIISVFVCDATRRILCCAVYNEKTGIVKQPLLFALVVFYAYYGLFYSAIAIRAGLALSICLEILSILCLPRQKVKKRLCVGLLFLLAWSFHTSIIILIPILLIFCLMKSLSKMSYMLLLTLSALIFFSRINLLLIEWLGDAILLLITTGNAAMAKFSLYTEVLLERESGLSFKYIFQLFSGFMFLFGDLNDRKYIQFLNVYMVGVLLGSVLAPIAMAYRILDFFYIITFVLYVQLFMHLKFHYNLFYIACGITVYQIVLIYRVIYA